MRYGVDGKEGERGGLLWTIGRDHLRKLGHNLGRDDQIATTLRSRSRGLLTAKTSRRQEPSRSMHTSPSEKVSVTA